MRDRANINSNWQFKKDCDLVPNTLPNWEIINLPHTWNNIDGMDGGNNYFRGKGTYVKVLSRENLPSDKLNYLEINGASSSADVFFNGEKLTHHDGGYSTFRALLPAAIKDENILVIQVDNAPNDRVYPQMADFTFYGGLYRDVNIISVPKAHFDLEYYGAPGVMATPHVEGSLDVKVFVKDQGDESIIYTLLDKENNVVTSLDTKATEVSLEVKEPHLWNGRKDPYLYTLRCSLTGGDEITTRVGFRAFEIDSERGFILNGEEYPLRGVSRHQDRWGKGNAISREDHEEDMALIMEVGATTIRLAHYQHDQYFYDLCDENGLVIWAEVPYISSHLESSNDNAISQMKELIYQNYNHPSIVVWGLSNEITMSSGESAEIISFHKKLNSLVHNIDSTRKTVLAALTTCPINAEYIHIPDVVSYNHYFGWYGGDVSMNGPWFDNFHKKYPNRPIGCSEYGCEALNWHTSKPIQGDYTEEYQAYYHEELIKQFFSRKYLWATHVWNMFDFGADARAEGGENGQNHKGLVTIDRKYKKDSFYAYKAWLSKEPFVHLCSKRYVDRVEPRTKVTVYSNLPEVALYVNGELVETKKAEDHFFHFEIENKGESHIRAVAGEFSDESVIKKVDTFNESYRLKEKGAILNWFDIEEIEGKHSLNSKIGDILKSFRGKLWFVSFVLLILGKIKKNKKSDKASSSTSPKANKDLLNMIKGFSVLRLTTMFGMINISITKEELLKLNKKLNKISVK